MRYWIDVIKYAGIAIFAGSVIAPKFVITDCLRGIWLLILCYILNEINGVLND